MAIGTSGPLALYITIRAEELTKNPSLSSDDFGIREVSASAGFTEPDAFSDFYGYSSVTLPVFTANPIETGKNDTSIQVRQNSGTYNNGNGVISSRGFYWGTSTNINSATKVQVDTSNSTGNIDRNFTGLSGGTTYRFWAYVENEAGEARTSGYVSITTLPTVSLTYHQYGGSVNCYQNAGGWSHSGGYGWGNFYFQHQYNHPYYGWSTDGSSNCSFATLRTNGGFYASHSQRNVRGNGNWLRTKRRMGSGAFHMYYNQAARNIGDVTNQYSSWSYFSHNSPSSSGGNGSWQMYTSYGWHYGYSTVGSYNMYGMSIYHGIPAYSLPAYTHGEQQTYVNIQWEANPV